MLNRASSTRIASSTVGISGTSISSTFDGRCVKTIVLISPIRAAIRAAARAETAASRLAAKKIAPRTSTGRPNRSWNQNASRLWMMNPPAKASSANSAARRPTMPLDRWRPNRRAIDVSTGGTSTAGETNRTTGTMASPMRA